MKTTVEVEGFKDLDFALAELPKATARNTLKRALTEVAQPIVEDAQSRAPVETGILRRRISISTRLNKSESRKNRRSASKSFAEVHIGPPSSSDISAWAEFGVGPHSVAKGAGKGRKKGEGQAVKGLGKLHPGSPPQPYMRPAWDAGKRKALEGLKAALAAEIEQARKRLARKAERLAAKRMKGR